jgi:hypothetical protein
MGIEIDGPVGDGKVLILLGLGMRYVNPGVGWMVEKFRSAGLESVVVGFPVDFSDVRKELVDPVLELERSMGEHVLIGISLGGLVAAFIQGARRRFFLSPFWGINDVLQRMGMNVQLKRMRNVNYRLLPRLYSVRDAGPFAVEWDLLTIPEWVSFRTLSAMVLAQDSLGSMRDDDVVYLSPQDYLVSQEVVYKKGVEVRTFEGGHMIHLVRDRDIIFDGIITDMKRSLRMEN